MRRPARNAKRQPALVRHNRVAPSVVTTVTPPAPTPDIASLLQAAVGHHQAGRASEAERLYRQVLALDTEQPDALHLLGVLAYQAGLADVAVPLLSRAVTLRPSAPAYRLNLGSALLALGRPAEAVTSYQQTVRLTPADPEAHYNLGSALIQHGDAEAGIAALRQALALRPDHLAARYNLGNALRVAGRLDEALDAYTEVVRQRPAFADAQTNLGTTLHALGRHGEARACFEAVLAAHPDDPVAHVNLAEALREQGQHDEAILCYGRALTHQSHDPTALRGLASIWQTRREPARAAELLGRLVAAIPDDPVAHDQYGRMLLASGRPEEALQAIIAGLERCPSDRSLIRTLVDLLQIVAVPDAAGPTVRSALLAACTDDTFDVQRLATPIMRIITADPAYRALLTTVRAGLDPLATSHPLPTMLLSEPAVLAALPRVVICSPDVERILTALRRSALMSALPRPFVCALAGAAFLVQYAWLVRPDEQARLQTVRAALTDLLADPDADPASAEDLLLLAALYGRLGEVPGSERLAAVPESRWSPEFVAVIREQVCEPLAERALAVSLPALTPIADETSQVVQAMYEANPYPRWRAARFNGPEPLLDRFRWLCPGEPEPSWPTPLPVLVAGAGTGQHPIQTALRLPGADVLAVDLSRPSLAYGARMAAWLGIVNLRFAQADILALDALTERFALIECGGVLHHLADPLAGWAVLRRLLRPDGLMLIALYSERARADIVSARAMISAEAIPPTTDGIRAARRRILDLPPEHPAASLTRFWDFYSESGFRDLAMHVQEHRFTIPRLAASLEALDLRFLGFEVPPAVMERFRARFPTPGAPLDLDCWDRFEADFPDTFASMYQLWCRPR